MFHRSLWSREIGTPWLRLRKLGRSSIGSTEASDSRVVYMEFPGAQHIFDLFYSNQSAQMVEGVLAFLNAEYDRSEDPAAVRMRWHAGSSGGRRQPSAAVPRLILAGCTEGFEQDAEEPARDHQRKNEGHDLDEVTQLDVVTKYEVHHLENEQLAEEQDREQRDGSGNLEEGTLLAGEVAVRRDARSP